MAAVISIDAGGTKTLGVLVSHDGALLGTATETGANYQTVGHEAANNTLGAVATTLFRRAAEKNVAITSVAFGLSGLDRPRDESRLNSLINNILPANHAAHQIIVNDAFFILRAGTTHGVGIAVVAGTGSNCVGRTATGKTSRIGGIGYEFGDDGGGFDIGVAAMRAAMRGSDGRGQKTTLSDSIRRHLGLQRLDDLVDAVCFDSASEFCFSTLVPLVFAASRDGDVVCRKILTFAGGELGLSARLLRQRLFENDTTVEIALGGSLWQRGTDTCAAMRDAFVHELGDGGSEPTIRVLGREPVIGGVLLGLDARGIELSEQQLVVLSDSLRPS